MESEHLVDHQIKIETTNQNGSITIHFSDGQQMVWPVQDAQLPAGIAYLTLSATPILPTKEELAKVVLREMFKLD